MLLAESPDLRARLSSCGRVVGGRGEVDLDAVQQICPAACRALESYHVRTSELWSRVAAGRAAGQRYVVTRRALVEHAQVTAKVGRRDLGDVFEDIVSAGELGEVLNELTGAEPDEAALRSLVRSAGGTLSRDDGVWTASVPMSSAVAWPVSLGGVALLCEVSRSVTLTVRHAAWRDRRVRRLAKVEVHVDELWADPGADRATLRAA